MGMLFKAGGWAEAHEFALGMHCPKAPCLCLVHATYVVGLHRSHMHLYYALRPCSFGWDFEPGVAVIICSVAGVGGPGKNLKGLSLVCSTHPEPMAATHLALKHCGMASCLWVVGLVAHVLGELCPVTTFGQFHAFSVSKGGRAQRPRSFRSRTVELGLMGDLR
jgi:hypothetical protein